MFPHWFAAFAKVISIIYTRSQWMYVACAYQRRLVTLLSSSPRTLRFRNAVIVVLGDEMTASIPRTQHWYQNQFLWQRRNDGTQRQVQKCRLN